MGSPLLERSIDGGRKQVVITRRDADPGLTANCCSQIYGNCLWLLHKM